MKTTIKFFMLTLIIIFAALSHADDQGFSKISLKTTNVSDNIYMLEGAGGFAGGNIGVSVGEDGILLIDDQLTPMSEKITSALAEIHTGSPKFILNTHWHGDHTGGNAHFSNRTTIIAHTNVRKRLMEDQQNYFGASPAQAKEAWPLITFDQSLTIHFNGEAIKFIHYPNGHTDGDGVVYFTNSNVAHLGDHYFTGMFPFVDLDSGGNVFSFTKNIKEIISALPSDVKIIPGHGALSNLDELKSYYEMLVETSRYVKNQASQGRTLEEIQQEGLPGKWKSWGNGFINAENWIMFIYNSI